jgi:subtilisin family serine protease
MDERGRSRSRIPVVGATLLVISLSLTAGSAAAAPTRPPAGKAAAAVYEGNPSLTRVSRHLLDARRLAVAGAPAAEVAAAVRSVTFAAQEPLIEIRLDRGGAATVGTAVAAAEAIGFDAVAAYPDSGVIVGTARLDLLDELADLPGVAVIRPEYGATTAGGLTVSQADVSINADDARAEFGVDGSGITVGVISDTFNTTRGGTVSGSGCAATVTGMTDQTSGDLPPSVGLLDNGGSGTDEGAAMAELIADLAPGADLMFHTAYGGEAGFAAAIDELVACGADVIVDDVIYYAEPMYQDGLVAQAAQAAVDAGVPYFSSAGNQATYGIEATYVDIDPPTDGTSLGPDLHDFGGDGFAAVTIPAGAGVRFVLQWDQPFSGTLGPGSAVDLDLYLLDAPDPAASTVAISGDYQGCSAGSRAGDPVEILTYVNTTGAPRTFYLGVDHYCGSEDVAFRVGSYGYGTVITGLGFESGVFDGPQIYGHAATEGVAAVAAVSYREIDSGGALTGGPGIDVESFSSSGGDLLFAFDTDGDPLAGGPITRFKPELAAPDGTNTTFFGSDTDGDGYPNFYGTSAAAPHAAAVAALLRQLDPALTPAQVVAALQAGATDIEAVGRDALAGEGLIDARDALAAAAGLDTTAPTWPGGAALTFSAVTGSSAHAAWTTATDDVAVTGYEVFVDGASWSTTTGTSIDLTGLAPGTRYTVRVEATDAIGNESATGPAGAVTTSVPLPPGGSFADDDGNIHEGNIEAIAAVGITLGCDPPVNDRYCPEAAVTRGQMAAFLVRGLELTDDGGGNGFVDVGGSVFEADIAKLAAAGITLGCNPPVNDRYCPEEPVRRDEMASFLARALDLTPIVPPA